jgi:MFS family permease
MNDRSLPDHNLKIWNRAFINIFLVNFFLQMGQQMTNILVPKYADALGASAYIVGVVSSIFAISSLVIRPFATPAFDSFSKKKLLIISIFGIFAVFIGYSLSTSTSVLIAIRLVHGISIGCVAPLSLAIASNMLPESQIGQGIGIFSLGQAVGQAIGPNMGLTLSRMIGYKYTFIIGSAIILIALIFAFFLKELDNERQPYALRLEKIIEKNAIPSAIILFLLMLSYSSLGGFLAIYGDLLNIKNVGLYFTVYAICLFATRPISGKLLDKYGYGKVLVPGLLCFASSFITLFMSRNLIGILIAAVLNAFGYGACYPIVQSMSMSCVPKNRRGAAGSTSFIGADFGVLMGASLGGLIIDMITLASGSEIRGYSAMYLIMTIPILLCLAYFMMVSKKISATLEQNKKMVEKEIAECEIILEH